MGQHGPLVVNYVEITGRKGGLACEILHAAMSKNGDTEHDCILQRHIGIVFG